MSLPPPPVGSGQPSQPPAPWPRPAYPPPSTPIPNTGHGVPPLTWGPPGQAMPPSTVPAPSRRRRTIAGIVVIVVGAMAGFGLLLAALLQAGSALDDFARAPAGCTTVLEFDRPGTYSVLVETRGELEQLPGDCPWTGSFEYEGNPFELPMRMVDPSAAEVPIRPSRSAFEYDLPWSAGQSVGTVEIDQPGDYRLTVEWTGSPAVVGIGQWPVRRLVGLALGGVAVGIAALVAGIVLLVTGRRQAAR